MSRKIIISGVAALIYWIGFWIDFFLDFHLNHYGFGFVLKALFPVAVLVNMAGAILILSNWKKERPSLRMAMLAVNLIPLLAAGAVLFWFVFLFRI